MDASEKSFGMSSVFCDSPSISDFGDSAPPSSSLLVAPGGTPVWRLVPACSACRSRIFLILLDGAGCRRRQRLTSTEMTRRHLSLSPLDTPGTPPVRVGDRPATPAGNGFLSSHQRRYMYPIGSTASCSPASNLKICIDRTRDSSMKAPYL